MSHPAAVPALQLTFDCQSRLKPPTSQEIDTTLLRVEAWNLRNGPRVGDALIIRQEAYRITEIGDRSYAAAENKGTFSLSLGGEVTYHGTPCVEIYPKLLEKVPVSRTCAFWMFREDNPDSTPLYFHAQVRTFQHKAT